MDEDDNGYNTMTYLTWCAEVQICLTIFRTFYFFLTELLWDHKFFPNVTGCRKTQASDCNKFHCINPYLLILISKATPVSACIGRCSNRITVSFNATFTLLKTEVKQKFDEAPSHKSVMIINHIQIVSAKIVLNQHRFPLPHWQNLSHKAFLVIVSILHYCLIHLRVLAFVYL
jgi:hypothetical protein